MSPPKRRKPATTAGGEPVFESDQLGGEVGFNATPNEGHDQAATTTRVFLCDHAWRDDPEIISLTRDPSKTGFVNVQLAGVAPTISVRTSDFINYPRFRAKVYDITGRMYGPIDDEGWQCLLHNAVRRGGAS